MIGQPVALSQRWGSVTIASGAEAVIDEANFDFGGGELNVLGGTTERNVLTLDGSAGNQVATTTPVPGTVFFNTTYTLTPGMGARVMVTNNNFYSNADTPISADPDALLATNPLTPLTSGNPFFRGNVMQYNGINGLGVQNSFGGGLAAINLTNNSVWDDTDIVYILRGTIVPENDPNVLFYNSVIGPGGGVNTSGGVSLQPGDPIPTPWITLTIESALPATPLANGDSVAKPGESVIVKALGTAPDGPGAGTVSTNRFNAGAGFAFGVDDGIDTNGLIDQGANSQLRILGIGGDETTGQQRVPAILTSVNDNTVGRTIRGVSMFSAIDGNTTAPKGGDAGIIYFGSLSLTTFNAFDVREGNKIDNADIHYFSRIELQGGGIMNLDEKLSDMKELTISNSNLSNFRDEAVLTHPGFNYIDFLRLPTRGEATELFMVNDSVYNNPAGVWVDGDNNGGVRDIPQEFVALNNTFYNNNEAVHLEGTFNNNDAESHIHFIAMDNIFSNSATAAVTSNGQVQGSIMEYNLFFSNGADNAGSSSLAGVNFGAIHGDPRFRNPANGNFQLYNKLTDPQHIGSAAIDAARSEMTLISLSANGFLSGTTSGSLVGTLIPLDDPTTGLLNGNSRFPDAIQTDLPEVLTLPGFPERGFSDQYVPILPTSPTSATFTYAPIDGQRDALGYLRVDDPTTPNVGFGSNPFYDIGAYEYRQLTPPHVTGVTAVVTDATQPSGTRTINLYSVGGVAGTNLPIQQINIQVDHNLDPNTINGLSVQLEASGGDGIFGNNNSPNDRFINLSGKLSFNSTTNVLTVNLGGSGLVLGNDEYRLFLHGNGSNVIRDPQGNALDGENTLNDDQNNPQLRSPRATASPAATSTRRSSSTPRRRRSSSTRSPASRRSSSTLPATPTTSAITSPTTTGRASSARSVSRSR